MTITKQTRDYPTNMPEYPGLETLLDKPPYWEDSGVCFLLLTKLFKGDEYDEETAANQKLYDDLGIESNENGETPETPKEVRNQKTPIDSRVSHVPFIHQRINIPKDDILKWFGGNTPSENTRHHRKEVQARRRHPLYKAIVDRLYRGCSDNLLTTQNVIYGVAYKAVKIALGLKKYESIRCITKRMSKKMGGMPISMILMPAKINTFNTRDKREVIKIFPTWTIPFLIASLPDALRKANPSPMIISMRVMQEFSGVASKEHHPTSHPLVTERWLLEKACECYENVTTMIMEEDVLANEILVEKLSIVDARIMAMEGTILKLGGELYKETHEIKKFIRSLVEKIKTLTESNEILIKDNQALAEVAKFVTKRTDDLGSQLKEIEDNQVSDMVAVEDRITGLECNFKEEKAFRSRKRRKNE